MTSPSSDLPTGAPGTSRPPSPQTGGRRSVRRTFAATVLVLEAFVVFFAALVAFGLRAAPTGVVWAVGGTLSLVLVVLSGMLRRPGAYLAGSVVQGLILASGFVLLFAPVRAASFVGGTALGVGIVFVALWVVALRLGGRIDREKAEWDAAQGETAQREKAQQDGDDAGPLGR
ncbi:DUF4233 domain-containing protein [Pengzhenrongella frigida]|uniref:DUF4233 domain-containing protein n=1 Tax=Pengzhenrongella frigida TaxID=1259133 RepID=A0A4Q5N6B1_9MICO|nr:DUF4233 domain-containing protein [Cellulomonas sp. HLT2-17]RYV51761.1 DUF4233 domain-containing protein [Cellulomonas sp. HLT2-17]